MVPLLLISLFTISVRSVESAKCYFPDGNRAYDDVPCGDATAGPVPCCGPYGICLNNGLCLSVAQPLSLARGSCTNQNWGGQCKEYCKNPEYAKGGVTLVLLNNTDGEVEYCCNSIVGNAGGGGAGIKCDRGNNPIKLPDNDIAIVPERALLANYTAVSTVSNNSTADTSASDDCDPNPIALGVGLAVPLGVIAIGAIAWVFWERRKREQSLQPTTQYPNNSRDNHSVSVAYQLKPTMDRQNFNVSQFPHPQHEYAQDPVQPAQAPSELQSGQAVELSGH